MSVDHRVSQKKEEREFNNRVRQNKENIGGVGVNDRVRQNKEKE